MRPVALNQLPPPSRTPTTPIFWRHVTAECQRQDDIDILAKLLYDLADVSLSMHVYWLLLLPLQQDHH